MEKEELIPDINIDEEIRKLQEEEKNNLSEDEIFKDVLRFIFSIFAVPIYVILQIILLIPVKIIYWIVRRFR